jgi:hypothetical protein
MLKMAGNIGKQQRTYTDTSDVTSELRYDLLFMILKVAVVPSCSSVYNRGEINAAESVTDNSEEHQRTYRDTQDVILEQRYQDKSESFRKQDPYRR